MKKGIEAFDLTEKVALVTGAVGHLGVNIVLALAEAGAHVLVNSRSVDRSARLVKLLLDGGYSAESAVFDVTDQNAVNNYFSERQDFPLHVLINNAYSGNAGNIESSTSSDYLQSYNVVMLAAHNLLNASLPSMRMAIQHCGDASVINLASMYGMVSPDQRIYTTRKDINPPFYGAAKAALIQWTRYAACEFGKEGLRINSISPGPFPSDNVQDRDQEFIVELSRKVPLGRIGSPNEIKGPILFLASSASTYVNGTNLVVDGGWTCW